MRLVNNLVSEIKLLLAIGCTSRTLTKKIKTVSEDLDSNGHISIKSVYVLQDLKKYFEKLPIAVGKPGHYKVEQLLPECIYNKIVGLGLPLKTHILNTDNGKIKTFAIVSDNATIALIREKQAEDIIYESWVV